MLNTFFIGKYTIALTVVLLTLLVMACPAEGGGSGGSHMPAYRYACANGTGVDATFDASSDASAPMRCRSCNTGWRLLTNESCSALCSESGGIYTLEPTADGGGTISFRMITVPVGTGLNFPTGVNDDGDATVDTPYNIAETELTYQVWRRVRSWAVDSARGDAVYDLNLGRAGSEGFDGGAGDGSADHPVTQVTRSDSLKFANALSEYCTATGSEPLYLDGATVMRSGTSLPTINTTANGFALPTGNEWELAARYISDGNNDGDIRDAGEYYPGNFASGATDSTSDAAATGAVAWYNTNSGRQTYPVSEKAANALALYDMNGNVWEWTNEAVLNDRVIIALRGGSWINGLEFMYVSRIIRFGLNFPSTAVGFRLVR